MAIETKENEPESTYSLWCIQCCDWIVRHATMDDIEHNGHIHNLDNHRQKVSS